MSKESKGRGLGKRYLSDTGGADGESGGGGSSRKVYRPGKTNRDRANGCQARQRANQAKRIAEDERRRAEARRAYGR